LPNVGNDYLWFYRRHSLDRWVDTDGGKERRHLFIFFYATVNCLCVAELLFSTLNRLEFKQLI
jgi:hypothetical protein